MCKIVIKYFIILNQFSGYETTVETTTQDNAEFCLRLERGPCPTSAHDPNGNDIALIHNGKQVAIARWGFTIFEYCMPYHEVDYENDVFVLINGGNDGVRIKFHLSGMTTKSTLFRCASKAYL